MIARAETLRRFWTMVAHSQCGLLNAANLARGLGVDGKTVARYLDLIHLACSDLKPEERFVVYSGTERFSVGHGVDAIGLPGLAARLQLVK